MRSQVATFVFAIVFRHENSAARAPQLLPRRDLRVRSPRTIAGDRDRLHCRRLPISAGSSSTATAAIIGLRRDDASRTLWKTRRRSLRGLASHLDYRVRSGCRWLARRPWCASKSTLCRETLAFAIPAGFRSRPAMIFRRR